MDALFEQLSKRPEVTSQIKCDSIRVADHGGFIATLESQ